MQMSDGGPNDRGTLIAFELAKSEKELKEKYKNGFLDFDEISKENYLQKKKYAEQGLEMFNLDLTKL